MSRADLPVPDPNWVEAKAAAAARALRRAVSATGLAHTRPGFGWTVRPAPGSVLASPDYAAWDPEPDYFHHWLRDAAIAIRAVPQAMAADPEAAPFWRRAVSDHIRFTLAATDPARQGSAANPLTLETREDHRQFLRPDAELAALTGEAWLEEPRLSADGAPDLERWGRPQFDGAALEASALMALAVTMPEARGPEAEALIARCLAFTAARAALPCIGPWEEEPARRTGFTLIAQWDALDRGGVAAEARQVAAVLGAAACPVTGGWRESVEAAPGALDAGTLLAILGAGRSDGPFALGAPRTRATLTALEDLFRALYPINRGRAVPAMGRWREDAFFGGNPWFPVTLGVAELRYRLAVAGDREAFALAEAGMALVAEFAPEGDDLPEQFDRETGVPRSSRALTWSAAAYLGAWEARRAALQAMAGSR